MVDEKKKEWEYEGKMWHKCPKCNKAIPLDWKSHQCGWGKEEITSESKERDIFRYQCLNLAMDLLKLNYKQTTPITEVSVNDVFVKAEEIYNFGKEKKY